MKKQLCLAALTALVLIACGFEPPQAPNQVKTGIEGIVLFGPIGPVVCDPCFVPFAATFHLFRGGIETATFQTREDGKFQVGVPPGEYLIVLDEDFPAPFLPGQIRQITVPNGPMITVRLEYDTGIV